MPVRAHGVLIHVVNLVTHGYQARCLIAASPEVHSLRSGLFRSASDLDDTAASIHNLEVQPMASRTRTSKTSTESTPTAKSSRGTSVNRVILVGRLVAKPELRETGKAIHVTTVRVATNDREQAEFHDVVLWRQHADFAVTYLTKGRQVYVEGRLQARTWTAADGTQRRTVEVVADNFRVLSPKPAAEPAA
jgi:single-strand DNA-binding protein